MEVKNLQNPHQHWGYNFYDYTKITHNSTLYIIMYEFYVYNLFYYTDSIPWSKWYIISIIGWGLIHIFGYPIKHPWIFKSYSFLSTPTCLGQYRLGPKHLASFNKKVNHDFDHKHSNCKVEALKSVNDPNFDTCFRSKWRNYVALHCEHRYIVFKTKNVTHSVKLKRDKMSTINIVHFAGEGMLN